MMENSSNEYHISFFKPANPHATANRNMVVWLVLIWFIAIFGFHILLRLIEKPTPEPAYVAYEQVWESIKGSSASKTDLQEFGKAALSVLGKVNILQEERQVLNNALSWSVYQLATDKTGLVSKIKDFEETEAGITNIADATYMDAKKSLTNEFSPILNLSTMDVRSKILPLELASENINQLTNETKNELPAIMGKYLIHNQSFLTDAKFLGFPFHYFYTAVFLLILFVGLCWLYCVKTDQLNAKFNVVD